MPSRSRVAFFVALALLCAAISGAGLVGFGAAADSESLAESQPPRSTIEIQLRADGDARWTVSTDFAVRTQNETAAFNDLAAEFETGDTSPLGLDSFRAASEAAGAATGREMTIRDVSRTHRIENETGTLAVHFTWTNFSREIGAQLRVDDAFNTTTGTWLPSLGQHQTLIIRPPEGYAVESASTGPVNGVLMWKGPRTFDANDLSARFHQIKTTPTTTPGGPQTLSFPPGTGLLFGIGAIVVVIAGYVAVKRRHLEDTPLGPSSTPEAPGGGSGPEPESPPPDTAIEEEPATPDAEPATAPPEAEEPDEEIDETLLSDEERVEWMLEQNGGRMKQATIVDETGWSDSKVSQLLSTMADDGRVEKLQIGRENLISLPEEDDL
jgi:hypothetical protein